MEVLALNSVFQTLCLLVITLLIAFIVVFQLDMGQYFRNLLDYFNNKENSEVFSHLDKFIELLEGIFNKLNNLFRKVKKLFYESKSKQ